ncbi:DUF4192 domain-containing protein [Gephyromycinifex aptenodytis]|uniref:DUF4192 domain-containing protein n=1 Tax=Gephyromycinifex aptenodytis TaxID=2716227 RepID=UPI0014470F0E|nr:DUF4192 domain-containing protein [Gephyromycinifex aptenodytis]
MTNLRVRGIGDLLAFLPYHLGFHPTDSLILISLSEGKLAFVHRLDRPAAGQRTDPGEVSLVLAALRRQPPDNVLIVGYGPGEQLSASAQQLREDLLGYGLPISEVVVVEQGRWRSVLCTDPQCCPADGQPLPEPSSVPAVCEYVGYGVSPSPDRAGLVRLLRPSLQSEVTSAFHEAVQQRRRGGPALADQAWRRATLRAWTQVLAEQAEASVRGLALAGLTEADSRDAVLAALSPAVVPPAILAPAAQEDLRRLASWQAADDLEECQRRRAVLVQLVREAPVQVRAPACTVLAIYAWSLGDGAMARVGLDEAFESDPSYPLADLMRRLLLLQVRPQDLSLS